MEGMTRTQAEALEEEPLWKELDWLRPGVRGSVVYRNIQRFAFRTSDASVLYWVKNKWYWASPRIAKLFVPESIE